MKKNRQTKKYFISETLDKNFKNVIFNIGNLSCSVKTQILSAENMKRTIKVYFVEKKKMYAK